MFACMLMMHFGCVSAEPPGTRRIDVTALYAEFLIIHLEGIHTLDASIQVYKEMLRKYPGLAERFERRIHKCYELRDEALRGCYRSACGLVREHWLRVLTLRVPRGGISSDKT